MGLQMVQLMEMLMGWQKVQLKDWQKGPQMDWQMGWQKVQLKDWQKGLQMEMLMG